MLALVTPCLVYCGGFRKEKGAVLSSVVLAVMIALCWKITFTVVAPELLDGILFTDLSLIKLFCGAILDNAKKCADQNPGYKVFDADGKVMYEPKAAEPAVKVPFLLKVSISDLNIRKDPGTGYARVQFCPPGVYTVVATSSGAGASLLGKLKSGIGWIALEYTVRL